MAEHTGFIIENGRLTKYDGPGGDVVIPELVTEIGDKAFMFCRTLTGILIPGSVKRIGESAFWYCENLRSVALEMGVETIDDEAFRGCKRLACVSLPESLECIGSRAFCECWELGSVAIPGRVTRIGSWVFRECRSLGSVSLPDGLTEIDDKGFYGCYSLTRIAIPAGVTRIGCSAFSWCYRLKTVTLPAALCQIDAKGFYGCTALTGLKLPEGLKCIGENAFYGCEGLTELVIPRNTEKIGQWAFNDCKGLVRVTITDSVTDFSVFGGCTSLEAFTVSPLSRRYREADGVVFSRDGRRLIAYPPGRCRVRYDIPRNVAEFPASAFDGAPVKVVFVPDGVKCNLTWTTGIENSPCFASGDSAFTARMGRNVYLGLPEDLPKRQKRIAVEGFLEALEIGMPELEPWKDGYVDYIRQEYGTYEKKSWRNEFLLRLLMEQGLLRRETAILMRRKFGTAGKNSLAEALDDYLAAYPDTEEKE